MVIAATIQNAAVSSTTSASVGETFKSVKDWMGHAFSTGGQALKGICHKIGAFTADFFSNFPKHIKSGYGIGGMSALLGLGLLTTALCLTKEDHSLARGVLMVTVVALSVLAGVLVGVFRGNPVSFS